jgi:hypothetical protein
MVGVASVKIACRLVVRFSTGGLSYAVKAVTTGTRLGSVGFQVIFRPTPLLLSSSAKYKSWGLDQFIVP